MRISIDAQSCASVPPLPAWMSMKQLAGSSGLLNMRRNSRLPTVLPSRATSLSTARIVASSPSLRARSNNSLLSASPDSSSEMVPTMPSRSFFSLPSACARSGESQILGSSSSRETTASRSDFTSKSKIPPQLGGALREVGERVGDDVDFVGFHGHVLIRDGEIIRGEVFVEPTATRIHRYNGGLAFRRFPQ